MAEDDFGAHDDYQRELDEEAEFEQQRADAERRNAAENVAGITVLQEGMHLHGYKIRTRSKLFLIHVMSSCFGLHAYSLAETLAIVCNDGWVCVP